MNQSLIEDVAAASAAYLYNLLPAILELPSCEAYERLKTHFETALLAYFEWRETVRLEPSKN